jgi:hypothetical protein
MTFVMRLIRIRLKLGVVFDFADFFEIILYSGVFFVGESMRLGGVKTVSAFHKEMRIRKREEKQNRKNEGLNKTIRINLISNFFLNNIIELLTPIEIN